MDCTHNMQTHILWQTPDLSSYSGGGNGEKDNDNDVSSCGSGDEDDLKDASMKSEPEYIMQHQDNRHQINLVSVYANF